jgi:hypothetical protein
MADDLQMLRKPVPMPWQWHRERRGRLRNARPQGPRGTTGVVMGDPPLQDALQMGGCQGHHAISTLAPKRPKYPRTAGMGSGSLGWRVQHPQAQGPYALVESLCEDSISVTDEDARAMSCGHGCAEVLWGPRGRGMRRHIDAQPSAAGVCDADQDIEATTGRRDHDADVTGDQIPGMMPDNC